MASYTHDYSNYPERVISLANYKDVDETVAGIINTIQQYRAEGDYASASAAIRENSSLLMQYSIGAETMNKIVEELRNTQIKGLSAGRSTIISTEEPDIADDGIVWISTGFGEEGADSYPPPMVIVINPRSYMAEQLNRGHVYTPESNCYAIKSYGEVYPSPNGTPVGAGFSLSNNEYYAYSQRPVSNNISLWSNPSENSSFSAQTVTLSDSIASYEYLEFRYKASTTSGGMSRVIIPRSEFQASASSTANARYRMGASSSSGTALARSFSYDTNTTVKFGSCYTMATSSTSTHNTYIIPLEVIGITGLNLS